MRKYFLCAAAGALMLSLAACADTSAPIEETVLPGESSSLTTEEAFDLDAFTRKAKTLHDEINIACIALDRLATWEFGDMTVHGEASDDMLERGYAWLQENSTFSKETIEEANDHIITIYTGLQLEAQGSEAASVLGQIESLYDSYSGLYSMVITKPQSTAGFQDAYHKYNEDIAKYSEAFLAECDPAIASMGNVFLNAKFETVSTAPGHKYGYCHVSTADAKSASMEDFCDFVDKRVRESGFNWITIKMDGNTGICFLGGDPSNAAYGVIDYSDYSLNEKYGAIIPKEDGTYFYSDFSD